MEIFRGNENVDVNKVRKAVVTIGNFDGCHLGHQEIFRRTREHAARLGGMAVVYTFDPHPAAVIRGITPELIFSQEEKIAAIASFGMDVLVIAPFTRMFANTNPENFVKEIIVRLLDAQGLVVGYDFSFGRQAAGDIPFLRRMGAKMGFFVESVAPVTCGDTVVSSSCIRRLIQNGDVASARRLLPHPFRLSGEVVHGMARGRNLGFPTANIVPDKALLPAFGVYAVFVYIGSERYMGAVNIGNNPTFGDVGTSIETFVFDFKGDLYGSRITVEFIEPLRGEIRFANKEHLIAQIESDCAQARMVLGAMMPDSETLGAKEFA